MIDYDSELRAHNEVLRRAYHIGPRDHVLDIGCGEGLTTRDAARIAIEGGVLGVDSSEPMVQRARELTLAEGIHNVAYACGDAQSYPFPSERFDVAISRFGTMFFADPVAAFTNIYRTLRPAGRLVMMVWQDHDRNEWAVSIRRALFGESAAPLDAGPSGQAFSLGDPRIVERILDTAGFGGIAFDDVHAPVCYGPEVDVALAFVLQFSNVVGALESASVFERQRVLERLRHVLAEHRTRDGVVFDSRAWLITAQRA